ncbi:MAG: zinc-dependent metalloprotease [Microcoleaceae cyanobacterium]
MRKIRRFCFIFGLSFLLIGLILPQVKAQQHNIINPAEAIVIAQDQEQASEAKFEEVIAGSERLEGLFTFYHYPDTGAAYIEIYPEDLNQNYLCFSTLESGLGEAGIVGGLELNEFLFQWRRKHDRVQFVLPNINFRTEAGDPQSRSVDRSFSESVLYSLPIVSIHPERKSLLVDVSSLLIGTEDLSGVVQEITSDLDVSYDANKSYINDIKVFPYNIEFESVLGFSGEENSIDSLPDGRSFNLRVRYSFLDIPQTNYLPRLADERVGYFTTLHKNLSNSGNTSGLVRYINRWHLEKQNPSLTLSPPVEPITFWIENTVPYEYRDAIKTGILMWNKAFEQAGFIDAIQVQQMPDDADWDPADVRYNTIRWSTSFQPLFNGYGPSHVNPLTGQILDADIILESNAITELLEDAEIILAQPAEANTTLASLAQSCSAKLHQNTQSSQTRRDLLDTEHLCFNVESQHQFFVGKVALALLQNVPGQTSQTATYINQYLQYLTAHEIGHALGLRHNFHGSTLLTPDALHDTNITRTQGLTSSVMDYLPVNLAPQGYSQGDYYPVIVGPYDDWVIEYGYTDIAAATPTQEKPQLDQIAGRASEPQLSYATDEDMRGVFLDPAANIYDLSQDILQYSQWQLDNARLMWQRLEQRSPQPGEGYDRVRKMFDTVLYYYVSHAKNLTLYLGGQSFNRDRADNPNGRLPFEAIPVEEQRQALQLLGEYIFAEDAFEFSPDLLNQLAPSRWRDWGNPDLYKSLEYPIGDKILWVQNLILWELFSPTRLTRLRDVELTAQPQEVLTLPELFETMQNTIWTEILNTDNQISISIIRRSLQREYLKLLSQIALRQIHVPEDAQTLARYQLKQLNKMLTEVIQKYRDQMDAYTLAHLEVSRDRLIQTLNAQVQSD